MFVMRIRSSQAVLEMEIYKCRYEIQEQKISGMENLLIPTYLEPWI
jgi:hypothetical protein